MNASPAEILRAALIAVGAADASSLQSGEYWPCFVDHLPNAPDQAVCVYGTAGIREGRIMGTGESMRKPGWQIRVRGVNHRVVWVRIGFIQARLDSIQNLGVNIDGISCILKAVAQVGDALDLGKEPNARRRINVTLNGTMTIGDTT